MKAIILFLVLAMAATSASVAQTEMNILIENGGHIIGGTLTLPENQTGNPLVIMATGSGAQDRNETIYGFEIFKVIAEDLALKGIPSFRYDDRGVGESSGIFDETTLQLMAEDIDAIIEHFKKHSEYSFPGFSILGHSQGGMVGAYTAARNSEVSQLILMASPTVPLKDVISEQVAVMQKMAGKTEDEIENFLLFQEKAYETVRTDSGWDALREDFRTLLESEITKLPEAQQAMIADMDALTEAQFQQQVQRMSNPQMRSLLFYDAGDDIEKLNIPILGIFGEKDTQVTPSQNAKALTRVCKENNLECKVEVIQGANHLFQEANTGLINEYPFLAKEFTDSFLGTISSWIKVN